MDLENVRGELERTTNSTDVLTGTALALYGVIGLMTVLASVSYAVAIFE